MLNYKKCVIYLVLSFIFAGCEENNRTFEDQQQIQAYIEEQQSDPEKFGQKILNLEEKCARSDKAACQEVELLLAIAGLNAPE